MVTKALFAWKKHSTKTALVRVTNDIELSLDNKKGTLIVFLDLSGAFDTIDHRILLAKFNGCEVV